MNNLGDRTYDHDINAISRGIEPTTLNTNDQGIEPATTYIRTYSWVQSYQNVWLLSYNAWFRSYDLQIHESNHIKMYDCYHTMHESAHAIFRFMSPIISKMYDCYHTMHESNSWVQSHRHIWVRSYVGCRTSRVSLRWRHNAHLTNKSVNQAHLDR